MKIKCLHGSPSDFDKFDISKFRLESLANDTKEFGIFCLVNQNPNTLIFNKAKYYALNRNKLNSGFIYEIETEIDDKRIINVSDNIKMSLDDWLAITCDIYKLTEHPKEVFEKQFVDTWTKYDNRFLMYILNSYIIRISDSKTCSEYLKNHGVDGTCMKPIINNFGNTIVISNPDCIKIIDKIKVEKSS